MKQYIQDIRNINRKYLTYMEEREALVNFGDLPNEVIIVVSLDMRERMEKDLSKLYTDSIDLLDRSFLVRKEENISTPTERLLLGTTLDGTDRKIDLYSYLGKYGRENKEQMSAPYQLYIVGDFPPDSFQSHLLRHGGYYQFRNREKTSHMDKVYRSLNEKILARALLEEPVKINSIEEYMSRQLPSNRTFNGEWSSLFLILSEENARKLMFAYGDTDGNSILNRTFLINRSNIYANNPIPGNNLSKSGTYIIGENLGYGNFSELSKVITRGKNNNELYIYKEPITDNFERLTSKFVEPVFSNNQYRDSTISDLKQESGFYKERLDLIRKEYYR